MADLRNQAMKIVQSLPDEKMVYVLDMLKWLICILDSNSKYIRLPHFITADLGETQSAWERLRMYKGVIEKDIDYF
jgi:hypothetical protein